MFYSHEVLTSRKHGVATIWLVATLGSRSTLKKINRKAILDVDIPKACHTVTEPEAPMALRLQSNLLYGISRVYSQQCMYILVDAQHIQTNMRSLLKLVRTSQLDPNAGKAKPHQLVVQDDPAFEVDMVFPPLDLDLSILESRQASSSMDSILSGQVRPSSESSKDGEKAMPFIAIPSSSSAGDLGGFQLPESITGSASRVEPHEIELGDEGTFFPDVDFNFDAEGNLIEFGAPDLPAIGGPQPATRVRSDSMANERVRQEHAEGRLAGQQMFDDVMELDIRLQPQQGDEFGLELLPAEPFPETETRDRDQSEHVEAVQAQRLRRPRTAKTIPVDRATQFRKTDMSIWNDNYVEIMGEAARVKSQQKVSYQAKKNAQFWVFGSGLGGIGRGAGSFDHPSALSIFAGDRLMAALTGKETSPKRKRERSTSLAESTDLERRTRPRVEEGSQLGRAADDDLISPADNTIELGRDPMPALEDFSGQMPWNISSRAGSHHSRQTSRQGSVALPAPILSSAGGFPRSAGGDSHRRFPSSIGPRSFDRRASRLPSASPLHSRGSIREGSITLPTAAGDDDEGLYLPSDDPALQEFELFGPAAAVSTQTAAQSQWVRAALNKESENFLNFVREEALATGARAATEAVEEGQVPSLGEVYFSEMLSPRQHSRAVAAQAFLHVLALASKGLLVARQDVGFGEIVLEVVGM